mmetsp:Transcript_19100/g.64522  ORF Transcript_19100/g.64522 Transcript_19100/m.64522 type:complete len:302 (-) Transcript_19100:1073-1978(-)
MEEHEALPRPARLVARREVVLPRAQRTPAHLRAEARRLARPRGCLFGTVPAARARGSRAMRRLRLGRHRRHARRARRRPRRRRRRPTPRQNRRPQPHLVRRCRVGRLRRRPRLRAAGRLAPRPRGAGRGFGGRCRGLHESRRRAHALVPRGVARRLSRLACAQRVCKGVQIQGSFVCRRNPRCGVCAVDFVLFAAAVGGRGARLCARELRRRRRPRLGPGALALRLWPIRRPPVRLAARQRPNRARQDGKVVPQLPAKLPRVGRRRRWGDCVSGERQSGARRLCASLDSAGAASAASAAAA